MLKRADKSYKTAHFGKWDSRFDGVSPEQMGYDVSDGTTGNSTGGGKGSGRPAESEDPKLIFSLTDRTKDFISQQHASSTPFYVQLSHYAVHLDIFFRKQTLESTNRISPGIKHNVPEFASMTSDLDTGIGLILDHLRALGIEENTYLFFFSDNGGRFTLPKQEAGDLDRNFPLRDGKGSMYEGGLRVPFMVMGPGIAKNVCSEVPVSALDIFPTLANLSGFSSTLPDQLDGGSLLPVLNNPAGQGKVIRRNEFMVFHQAVARKAQSAIMHGNLKLVKTWADNRLELFDLSQSPSESENLSDALPEERERLHRLLCNYLAEVDAETAKTTTKQQQRQ